LWLKYTLTQPFLSCNTYYIIIDKPRLKDVLRKLLPLAAKWQNIGTLLGIQHHILERIQHDNGHDCSNCLREMLNEWLKNDPTWKDLAEAIKPFNPAKADEIRRDYNIEE
jgi:hypothetical protein